MRSHLPGEALIESETLRRIFRSTLRKKVRDMEKQNESLQKFYSSLDNISLIYRDRVK
jgi:hypothetical protein